MYPKSPQIYLAQSVGEYIANILTSIFGDIEETEPKYKITNDNIIIYNFGLADDSGYYITNDLIELVPTNKSYNLLAINGNSKCKKIFVNGDALCSTERKKIIENTIRVVLTELNFASESSRVNILNDGTLLVSSDDWS